MHHRPVVTVAGRTIHPRRSPGTPTGAHFRHNWCHGPRNRSTTQAGRPAASIAGGGSGRRGPLAAEVVLDPDDVVELGRGHLDELGRVDRLEPWTGPTGMRRCSPGPSSVVSIGPSCGLDDAGAAGPTMTRSTRPCARGTWSDRRLPASMYQDLADISVGVRPDQLVAPGLVDPPGGGARRSAGTAGSRAADELLAGRDHRVARLGRGGLRVDPDQRLGAAEAGRAATSRRRRRT